MCSGLALEEKNQENSYCGIATFLKPVTQNLLQYPFDKHCKIVMSRSTPIEVLCDSCHEIPSNSVAGQT